MLTINNPPLVMWAWFRYPLMLSSFTVETSSPPSNGVMADGDGGVAVVGLLCNG